MYLASICTCIYYNFVVLWCSVDMPITRLQELQRKQRTACELSSYPSVTSLHAIPEHEPLTSKQTLVDKAEPSGILLNQGPQLRLIDPTSHLRKCGVTVRVRRSVYFLLTGMLIYLLSWSSVLCRVTRGIVQYPDRMPTAVWVSTLGILLFYETFIIAQCTSMSARVRQIMAAQRPSLAPVTTWNSDAELQKCSVMRAFYVQACALGKKRDSFYLSFIHFLSMPDWESIAFLAGGATIDLVSAVLYSVPLFREDLFGLPEDQQLAEPWATMAFLLLVWLLTVTLTALWEKHRHRKLQQASDDAANSDHSNESAWDFDDEDQEGYLDSRLGAVDANISPSPTFHLGRAPCFKPLHWLSHKLVQCMNRVSKAYKTTDTTQSDTDQQAGLLRSLNGLPLWSKLALGFVIYGLVGAAVFVGWGFLMKLWIEADALPWIVVLITLALLLFRQMYVLGKWRLKAHYDETPPKLNEEQVHHRMDKFGTYHVVAALFHCALIGLTLFLGSLNSDLDWADDYLGLKRPAYFMTADWERVSDIQDDNQTKATLLALAANSSDPFLGIQGATSPKIPIGYCATSQPLQVYFLYICMAWSACSAAQHLFSWYRIRHFEQEHCFRYGKVEYGLTLCLFTLLLVSPGIQRYGWSWQPVVLFGLLLPITALGAQVTGLGVFDLFDDADETLDTKSSLQRLAKLALRDVRCYKWVEYTLSATAMHVVVTYIGGVLNAHELVLSAGALATAMLFCNFSDSNLHSAEEADERSGRRASVITVGQTIDTEMPFLFLSFFAKGVLCVALTVPWVFVNRGDYVVQPQACT